MLHSRMEIEKKKVPKTTLKVANVGGKTGYYFLFYNKSKLNFGLSKLPTIFFNIMKKNTTFFEKSF